MICEVNCGMLTYLPTYFDVLWMTLNWHLLCIDLSGMTLNSSVVVQGMAAMFRLSSLDEAVLGGEPPAG